MKKIFKTFFTLALGLSLALAGCSKDEKDLRSELTGNYDVTVTVEGLPAPVAVPATLTVSKDGDGFKVVSVVSSAQLPMGDINLSLLLSSLAEVNGETDEGTAFEGYLYKIAEQPITVGAASYEFFGTAADYGDYAGTIAQFSDDWGADRFIDFQIAGVIPELGLLTITVGLPITSSSESRLLRGLACSAGRAL